jgi:hypothetical protein
LCGVHSRFQVGLFEEVAPALVVVGGALAVIEFS